MNKVCFRFRTEKVQQQKSSVLDTAIGSLYLEILEKISFIRLKVIQSFGTHNLQAVFQHNLMITGFTLRRNQIDKNLEFKTLAQNYSSLLGTGFPNDTFAGMFEKIMYSKAEPSFKCIFLRLIGVCKYILN